MPFNGSGTFTRLYSWTADAAVPLNITASRMDADTNDIVSNGLNNCLTRDGQGKPSADINWNNYKLTNVSRLIVGGTSDDGSTAFQLHGDMSSDEAVFTLTNSATNGHIDFVTNGSGQVRVNGVALGSNLNVIAFFQGYL